MKYLVLLFFIISNISGLAQVDSTELKYLTNKRIKFQLIYVSLSAQTKRTHPVGYFVEIEMPKPLKNIFLNKPKEYWIEKLNSTDSDWAANILLYYLYKRESSNVYFIKIGVLNWEAFKEKEIKYWKEFLKE